MVCFALILWHINHYRLFNAYTYIFWAISLMSRVFTSDSEDQGSIPGRVISKTQKMVLDTTLLNTQQYEVRIKGKV